MLKAVLFITGKTTDPGNHPTADQPKLDKLSPIHMLLYSRKVRMKQPH